MARKLIFLAVTLMVLASPMYAQTADAAGFAPLLNHRMGQAASLSSSLPKAANNSSELKGL